MLCSYPVESNLCYVCEYSARAVRMHTQDARQRHYCFAATGQGFGQYLFDMPDGPYKS